LLILRRYYTNDIWYIAAAILVQPADITHAIYQMLFAQHPLRKSK
jgi:hypothetical protein